MPHALLRLRARLAAPRFQSARLGLTRDFDKGLLRIYVGPTEAAAAAWFTDMEALMRRHKPAVLDGLGDQAVAAGDGMVLTRDGNVGVLVEAAAGARGWAERALAAIEPGPAPWPAAPALVADPSGGWVIVPADAPHVAFTGGRLAPDVATPGAPLRFTEAPRRVVVWDRHGRAAVQDFGPLGDPVATSPLRPDPDAPDTPNAAPSAPGAPQ